MQMSGNTGDNKSGKRVLKWIVGALLVFSFLIIFIVSIFLDSLIKNRIIKEVREASDGLYILSIEDLDAKFWSGAIRMKNVWLRPDGLVLQRLREKDTSAYIPNVNFHLDYVNISSINWKKYLLNPKKLEIGKVLILKPDFIVEAHIVPGTDLKESNKNFLDYLPGIVAAFIGSLKIEAIEIKDGNVNFDLHSKDQIIRQVADSIHLDLTHIVIDTISPHNALYSKTALIDIKNYKLTSSDHLHFFKIKRVFGKIEDSTLYLTNVNYHQKDTGNANYKDEIFLKVKGVECLGIDYKHIFQNKKIGLRTLKFSNPSVELYASKDPVEKYSESRIKDTSILKEIAPYISQSFLLDSFLVKDGKVLYHIKNESKDIFQSAENIYLSFSHIRFDSLKMNQKVLVEDVNLRLNNYRFSKDKNTSAAVGYLKASVKDSSLYMKNIRFNYLQKDTLNMTAGVFKGKGLDYILMLKNKTARFEILKIENPEIKIVTQSKGKTRHLKKTGKKEDKSISGKTFLSDAIINSNKAIITGAKIEHKIRTAKGLIEQKANDLFVELDRFNIDSSSAVSFNFYKKFNVKFKDYNIKVHNDNFTVLIKDVEGKSDQSILNLNDIFITQINSFGPDQPYYFTDSIKNAKAFNVDFKRFFLYLQVHAGKVKLDKMNLNIYLDEGKESPAESSTSIPQDLMRKLPFYLRIDTAHIIGSSLSYFVNDPKLKNQGKIYFDQINLNAYNFTNDSKLMTQATPCKISTKGLIMGKGSLELTLDIPFLSKGFDIKYSGNVGPMEGNMFNDLLESADLRIEKGKVLSGKFNVNIKGGKASGELTFCYENLHIEVLNQDKHKKSKIKSLIGNFIVKNGNPKEKGKEPETVSLSGTRTIDDSFFFFIWAVLRDGIVKTVTKDTLYDHVVKH